MPRKPPGERGQPLHPVSETPVAPSSRPQHLSVASTEMHVISRNSVRNKSMTRSPGCEPQTSRQKGTPHFTTERAFLTVSTEANHLATVGDARHPQLGIAPTPTCPSCTARNDGEEVP